MFMDENMFLKNKTCRYKVGTWMNVMDKCLITTAIWDILDNVRILVSYYRPPTTPSLQTVAHWFKKKNRWPLSFTLMCNDLDILKTRELHIVSFLTTLFEEKETETAEVKNLCSTEKYTQKNVLTFYLLAISTCREKWKWFFCWQVKGILKRAIFSTAKMPDHFLAIFAIR